MASEAPGTQGDTLTYEHAGMPKTGTWWSAFVIGLAGTILVTVLAGPLNYVGVNPKLSCHLPSPSN